MDEKAEQEAPPTEEEMETPPGEGEPEPPPVQVDEVEAGEEGEDGEDDVEVSVEDIEAPAMAEASPKTSQTLGRIQIKQVRASESVSSSRTKGAGQTLRWWLKHRDSQRPPLSVGFRDIVSRAGEHPELVDVAPTKHGPWVPLITGWDYTHPQIGSSAMNPRELLWALRHYTEAQREGFVLAHRGGRILMNTFLDEAGDVALWWCYRSRNGEGFARFGELGELTERLAGGPGAVEVSPNPDRVGWVPLTQRAHTAEEAVLPEEPDQAPGDEALVQTVGSAGLEEALRRRVWCWPEPASWGLMGLIWGGHLLYATLVALRHPELVALPVLAVVALLWTFVLDRRALRHARDGGFRAQDALQAGTARRWATFSLCATGWLHAVLMPYRFDSTPFELALATALVGTATTSLILESLGWRRCMGFVEVGRILIQPGLAMGAGLAINAGCALAIGLGFMSRTDAGFWVAAVACGIGALIGWLRPLSALSVERLRLGWIAGPLDPAAWWFPASAPEALSASIRRTDFITRVATHGPVIQSSEGADGSRFGRLLRRAMSGSKDTATREALVVLAPLAPDNLYAPLLKKRLGGLSVRGFSEDAFKDAALARLFEGARQGLEALGRLKSGLDEAERDRLVGWLEAVIHTPEAMVPSRARWSFHVGQARRAALRYKTHLAEGRHNPREPRESFEALRQNTGRVLRLLQSPAYWGDRLIAASPPGRRHLAEALLLLVGGVVALAVAILL